MRVRVVFPALVPVLLLGCGPSVSAPSAPPTPRTDDATPAEVRGQRPIPPPLPYTTGFAQAIRDGTRDTSGRPGPGYWQQRVDYDIDATVSPEARRLEGMAAVVYHNQSPDTLADLYVNLILNMHRPGAVRNVTAEVTDGIELTRVAAMGRTLREGSGYAIDGTVMRLTLPRPVAPGTTVELGFNWTIDLPEAGAWGRMGYSGDNLLFLAYWFPQVAVYDDVIGWHRDDFRGIAEFYSDFGRYDLTIEAPEQWLLLGTGTLQNPDEVLAPRVLERLRRAEASDSIVAVVTADEFGAVTRSGAHGTVRWHLVADSVRDVAFSLTRESAWDATRTPVGDRDGDGATDYARIDAVYRRRAPLWREAAAYAQHAIAFLSRFTATPYPWPHMTAVEGSGIIDDGMEYPMMTLIGDYNALGDRELYFVVAHELAHMWVPMIVSNNERRYSWLDEGTTTFNENNARSDFYPGMEGARRDQEEYIRTALSGTEGEMMRWSDWHYQGAFHTASYAKPASVLRALRGVLGEETFARAYQAFFDRWQFRHAYPWDLWNTFENVSGRDLDWFWRAWYYESTETGDPWVLDQGIEAVTSLDDGGTRIRIRDHGWVPMPVRLAVTRSDGGVERLVVSQEVWLQGRTRTSVVVAAGAPVTRVEIDPEHYFPDVDRSNNVWERAGGRR